MTLYRKYRPQKLEELDLLNVKKRLLNLLISKSIPHALLFAGPKGTGKTSAARIVAKIINCQKRDLTKRLNPLKAEYKDIDPCDICDSCREIIAGGSMDVLEIDAASNRGIEEIRELREKIRLAPISSRFKVYIIDEVHMLTKEAFNAFLKTLEEPPAHAIFIMATTEPEKMISTILSRCTVISFTKATVSEIVSSLQRVTAGEKVKIDDEMLEYIAGLADGSFRDATKILEQVITENISDIEKLSKLMGFYTVNAEKFLHLMLDKKAKEMIADIVKMSKEGSDFRYFVSQILFLLHDVLVSFYKDELNSQFSDLKSKLTPNETAKLISLFSKIYIDMKGSLDAKLPLEAAIIQYSHTD
jgi:DNA polymerase-3 subunit gamma/tau